MAKKKTTKKKNRKTAKKKSAKKAAPKKKAVRKKSTSSKSSAGKPAAARESKSVDGIIKRYTKERNALESKLTGYEKKKEELETRAAKLKDEIARLIRLAEETASSIGLLDVKRDAEIGSMLSRLGVQLGGQAVSVAPVANDEVVPVESDAPQVADLDDAEEDSGDPSDDGGENEAE